jgi:hypothetical protein
MIISLALPVPQHQLDVSQPAVATKPVGNALVVLILFGVAVLLIVAIRCLGDLLARALILLGVLVLAFFVVVTAAVLSLTARTDGPPPGPVPPLRPATTLLAPSRLPDPRAQRTPPRRAPSPSASAGGKGPSGSPGISASRPPGPAVFPAAGG